VRRFDDLVTQVNTALRINGIPDGDIDTLAYPNALNMIAGLSVRHDPTERAITKRQFLEALKSIRKTAISRWTMALRTRKQLLDARRKQMKTQLDKTPVFDISWLMPRPWMTTRRKSFFL